MKEDNKLGLLPLTMLVIGSLIGGGIFDLMQNMSKGAGLIPMLIAWGITAVGMGTFVLCFQNLSQKRPDLTAGIYSYAKEGFGNFMGFNSAWGYWLSAWLGNVAYAALLFSSLGYFFKFFGDGNNVASIIGASIVLWCVHFLILRGVSTAAFINTIVTFAKLVPLVIFLIAAVLAFKLDIFSHDIWGVATGSSVLEQVNSTMQTAVWVFIGIEGAVVFSGHAKSNSDIGKASILALLTMVSVYVLISVLSLGIMTRPELAELKTPAMAYVLEKAVGHWGAVLVNIGVIISVFGAILAWTLFAAELPYQAAKEGAFPKFFAKENVNKAPVNSLLVTNICVQLFLITFLFTKSAYRFGFALASSAILIPYAFTALFQLKYTLAEAKNTPGRTKNLIVGIVASIYSVYLIYAGGFNYLLLTMIAYALGMLLYIKMRRDDKQEVFTGYEKWAAVVILVLCVVCIIQIFTGQIDIQAILNG